VESQSCVPPDSEQVVVAEDFISLPKAEASQECCQGNL
jgi:hypothetical protein